MKNKDIEKNIRLAVSPEKDRIWAKIEEKTFGQPAQTLVTATANGNGNSVVYNGKRNVLISIGVVFLAVIIAICCFIPNFIGTALDYTGSFFIDINPSIQVSVDKDGKVTDVVGVNQDALVLLQGANKENMLGKSGEEVACEIWDLAFTAGYILPTQRDNAVLVTGSLDDENQNLQFGAKIKDYLTKHSKDKGVYCAVITKGLDNSSASQAESLGISPSKYQIILTAQALGVNISENEYKTISIKEINKRVLTLGKTLEDFGGKDYKEVYEGIEEYVEELKEELLDGIADTLEFLENVAETLPNGEILEDEIEVLTEILDDIEDNSEEGRSTDQLFELLSQNLEGLTLLGEEFGYHVAYLKILVDEVKEKFDQLALQVDGAKQRLKAEYDELVERNRENCNHQKPERFDDDYDEWLSGVEDDFRQNWEERKNEWSQGRGWHGGKHLNIIY